MRTSGSYLWRERERKTHAGVGSAGSENHQAIEVEKDSLDTPVRS
jgi:hypothetical protein